MVFAKFYSYNSDLHWFLIKTQYYKNVPLLQVQKNKKRLFSRFFHTFNFMIHYAKRHYAMQSVHPEKAKKPENSIWPGKYGKYPGNCIAHQKNCTSNIRSASSTRANRIKRYRILLEKCWFTLEICGCILFFLFQAGRYWKGSNQFITNISKRIESFLKWCLGIAGKICGEMLNRFALRFIANSWQYVFRHPSGNQRDNWPVTRKLLELQATCGLIIRFVVDFVKNR